MDFFINRKRFEFVGRCEDETLGRSTAFLAALSTFSLPGICLCALGFTQELMIDESGIIVSIC